MGPVRELASKRRGDLSTIRTGDMPAITKSHFIDAFETVLPSVSPDDLQRYIDWNNSYGSTRRAP